MQVHAPETSLDAAFRQVCANEAIADYRDLEPVLVRVASAILAGWEPCPEALEGPARRRAGYLLDVLRAWMPDARADAWMRRLNGLLATASELDRPVAFWHADRGLSGNDDLARRWGLMRGLELGRLRQALIAHR